MMTFSSPLLNFSHDDPENALGGRQEQGIEEVEVSVRIMILYSVCSFFYGRKLLLLDFLAIFFLECSSVVYMFPFAIKFPFLSFYLQEDIFLRFMFVSLFLCLFISSSAEAAARIHYLLTDKL